MKKKNGSWRLVIILVITFYLIIPLPILQVGYDCRDFPAGDQTLCDGYPYLVYGNGIQILTGSKPLEITSLIVDLGILFLIVYLLVRLKRK